MPRPYSPRPPRARLLGGLALALLAAVAVGGCGDGDGAAPGAGTDRPAQAASPAPDESRIRAVIHESMTTRDPSACRRLATQRFLEQVTFETGAAAHEECRANTRKTDPARSVLISHVMVDGATARAHVAPTGGDADGQAVTYALVKSGGSWKLDRVTAMKIDRARFDAATRRALLREPDALTPEQADCVIRQLRPVADERLERALVESDRSVFLRSNVRCLRAKLEATIRDELLKGSANMTPAQADCVIAGLHKQLTDQQLEDILAATGSTTSPPKALSDALTALAAECTSNSTVT